MASSQFTVYSSGDLYGPGPLTGTTGSLLTIFDACLVNGYSGKPSAGWSKPFANISGSIGCYKQGSGSLFTMFVNDSGPNTLAGAKEAWITGWEMMTSLAPSGSAFTGSNSAGSGWGQFPLPAQLLTYGHVVWRKSVSADTNLRQWIVIADAATMYLWIQTGDTATYYYHGGFGDFFSFNGIKDMWNCFIYGRSTENIAAGPGSYDWTDMLTIGPSRDQSSHIYDAQPGHFTARNQNGFGGSQTITKKGDAACGTQSPVNSSTATSFAINGVYSIPNSSDMSIYISPIYVIENATVTIRGYLRGLYQICHPSYNFYDGQIINGSGDYAGKQFLIIKTGICGNSFWGVEMSPTVDTN